MAVAVKNSPETSAPRMVDRLPVSSLLGMLFVLGSLGVVFYGLPALWWSAVSPITGMLGSFFDVALFVVAMVGVGAGLAYLGTRLLGPQPAHGIRAGIFVAIAGVVGIGFLTWALGAILESLLTASWLHLGQAAQPIGLTLTVLGGLALCYLAARSFVRPEFERRLIRFEDQGWFSAKPYKKSQGLKVRRGTMLGILALAGAGIYTMISHNTLGTGANNHWTVRIPFTDVEATILPDIQYSLPLILTAASLWLTYRVVNYPTFADFLIATEAELNKVSWTSRRRLVQDTIVVLTTVILLTIFLFLVDVVWSQVLSSRYIGVLKVPDEQKNQQADERQQPW
jgi:preprotein translocase SecE subunit